MPNKGCNRGWRRHANSRISIAAAQLMRRRMRLPIDRPVGREGQGHIVPVTDGDGTSYDA
jgi:hypothetical protein